MSDKNSQPPEFLQIKGYKYRARMLLAAAGILLLIIVLIVLAVHAAVSSDKHRSDADTDSSAETDFYVSEAVSKAVEPEASVSEAVSSAQPEENDAEKKDANGKLIIDTDIYDGKKAVAITFDDGPGQYTEKLIKGLNERNAKATFFMVGSCVEQYPDALPLMVEGGHQLGNHTYNHTDITTLSGQEMMDQITKTDNAIFSACGEISTAFRPPYGAYTADTNKAIDKIITLWSIDTEDWKLKSADAVKKTIVSQCWDGDIILLHDIYETSVDGALSAIDELSKQGFVFVTVDELLTRYGYEIEKGKAHSSQYSVYETNSPHAKEYEAEINSRKAAEASSSAANAFYNESSEKEKSSEAESSDTDNNGAIAVITSDSEKERLVY